MNKWILPYPPQKKEKKEKKDLIKTKHIGKCFEKSLLIQYKLICITHKATILLYSMISV